MQHHQGGIWQVPCSFYSTTAARVIKTDKKHEKYARELCRVLQVALNNIPAKNNYVLKRTGTVKKQKVVTSCTSKILELLIHVFSVWY